MLSISSERWSNLSLLDSPDWGNQYGAERVIRAASDHLYSLGDWAAVDLLEDVRRSVMGEDERPACLYWVGVYLEDRAWGGREEGGWWFDYGTLQTADWVYKAAGSLPSCHTSWAAAMMARDRMAAGLKGLNEDRNSDISSVCSDGCYSSLIFEDSLPKFFPESRPRYS